MVRGIRVRSCCQGGSRILPGCSLHPSLASASLSAHRTVLCDPGWGPALSDPPVGLSLPHILSCWRFFLPTLRGCLSRWTGEGSWLCSSGLSWQLLSGLRDGVTSRIRPLQPNPSLSSWKREACRSRLWPRASVSKKAPAWALPDGFSSLAGWAHWAQSSGGVTAATHVCGHLLVPLHLPHRPTGQARATGARNCLLATPSRKPTTS